MKEEVRKNLSYNKWDNSLPRLYFFQLLSLIIIFIVQFIFIYNVNDEEAAATNIITSIFMSFGIAIITLKNHLPNLQFLFRIGSGKYNFYRPVLYENEDGSYMNETKSIKNYIIGGLIFLFGFIPSLLIFLMKNKLI